MRIIKFVIKANDPEFTLVKRRVKHSEAIFAHSDQCDCNVRPNSPICPSLKLFLAPVNRFR